MPRAQNRPPNAIFRLIRAEDRSPQPRIRPDSRMNGTDSSLYVLVMRWRRSTYSVWTHIGLEGMQRARTGLQIRPFRPNSAGSRLAESRIGPDSWIDGTATSLHTQVMHWRRSAYSWGRTLVVKACKVLGNGSKSVIWWSPEIILAPSTVCETPRERRSAHRATATSARIMRTSLTRRACVSTPCALALPRPRSILAHICMQICCPKRAFLGHKSGAQLANDVRTWYG